MSEHGIECNNVESQFDHPSPVTKSKAFQITFTYLDQDPKIVWEKGCQLWSAFITAPNDSGISFGHFGLPCSTQTIDVQCIFWSTASVSFTLFHVVFLAGLDHHGHHVAPTTGDDWRNVASHTGCGDARPNPPLVGVSLQLLHRITFWRLHHQHCANMLWQIECSSHSLLLQYGHLISESHLFRFDHTYSHIHRGAHSEANSSAAKVGHFPQLDTDGDHWPLRADHCSYVVAHSIGVDHSTSHCSKVVHLVGAQCCAHQHVRSIERVDHGQQNEGSDSRRAINHHVTGLTFTVFSDSIKCSTTTNW